MSPNLGELRAFIHDSHSRMISDVIFHRHPLLLGFKRRERPYPGGDYIREGLEYGEDRGDVTGRAIARTGTFDITEFPAFDAAQYRPAYYVQVIPFWDADIADNGTSEVQYWDFVKNRRMNCMKIMQARFARHLYSSGQGTQQINGLGDFFNNQLTIGRVDRTKYPWWRAFVHGSTNAENISTYKIANIVGDTSDGDIRPDLAITSVRGWTATQAATDPRERFQNTTLANLGFQNISYQGLIPIISDKYCDIDSTTRHKMYFINFDHIFWRPHRMYNMKMEEMMRMPKNLGQYTIIIWFGNITTNNPRRLGLLKDINPVPA